MGIAFKVEPTRPNEPDAGYGAGRGTTTARREPKPRVPIIGVDAGAIPGTMPRPGCSGAYLERAGREIVRSRLHRNRFKEETR